MYPDLLEIFGITLYGPIFERVLWGLLGALMIWGIISSILIIRKGRVFEGGIQGLIVLSVLIWAGKTFISTFESDYALVFSQPVVLHSYAFCILVGITLGTLTAMKMANVRGRDGAEMGKLCIWLIIIGFLGARAAHVIVEGETYWNACFHPDLVGAARADCLRVLNFAEGGLTFYGGVISGLLVIGAFLYNRHRRGVPVEALSVMDMLGAALAVSHAFGRIGCLAAGCCWGAITTGTLGIHYKSGSFAWDELIKIPGLKDAMLQSGETPLLHATQIYEAAGEFVIYAVLWTMLFKKVRYGMMAGVWLIGYGVLRFIVEFMRDDGERGYYFEQVIEPINHAFSVPAEHATILSTSQGIALGMIAFGIAVIIISCRNRRENDLRRAREVREEVEKRIQEELGVELPNVRG